MVASKILAMTAASALSLYLQGCGSGGGGGGGDGTSTTTTAKPSGSGGGGTTVPTDPCAGVPTVPSGQDALVDELNRNFTGFKPDDPASPSGVTIRVADNFDYFCGTPCNQGWPDCRVSSSLYNSVQMFDSDHKIAITMLRDAGILFNQAAVEGSMGKCSYFYDAATFGRLNRGCGCAAEDSSCGRKGPYQNLDCRDYNDLSTCHNNTDQSPNVEECWCKSTHRRSSTPAPEDQTTTSQQCYYKLGGLYLPNGLQQSELHEMVVGRVSNQEHDPGNEPHKRTQYWNEIIIDAEEMNRILHVNPSDAVTAFVYVKSFGDSGKKKALAMQAKAMRDFGGPQIPIIAINSDVDTRCGGIFEKAADMPTTTTNAPTTTWDGTCAQKDQKCGGGAEYHGPTCCVDGQECCFINDWYSQCQDTCAAGSTTVSPTEAPTEAPTDPPASSRLEHLVA